MAKRSYIDSIDVPKPCDADWKKMTGDDKKRFCSSCKKDVYNLSAMSRRKARKLIAQNVGKICVRYARLPNGKLYTTDNQLVQITRRTTTIAAGVIATTLTLSASAYSQGEAIPQKSKEKEIVEQTEKSNKTKIGTSQISFTITDFSGAVIPDAKVKLISEKTKDTSKIELIAYTNGQGIANFSSLKKARYKVEVEAAVFDKKSIYIYIKQEIEPNVKIDLQVSTIIEVIGDFTEEKQYEIPFFRLILQEDLKSIIEAIARGSEVNTKDKNGETALHVAVENENLEIARLLVQNKANINAQDKKGRVPLMMMDEFDTQTPVLKYLVKKGANVNIQDKDGKTPLMYAAYHEIENLEVLKVILKAGAKLETRDKKGNTALIVASDGFSKEIVKELLKAGASPNVENNKGETPLTVAGSRKYITELLRGYGAIK